MCLFIDKNYHKGKVNLTQSIVTDTDIQVWKCLDVMDDCYYTPYMERKIKFDSGNGIATQSCKRFSWGDNEKTSIARGIHSFWSRFNANYVVEQFNHTHGTNKFYAVIPKGSHIFIGNCGDIVSDKLIIFKTVFDFYNYEDEHDVIDATKYVTKYLD